MKKILLISLFIISFLALGFVFSGVTNKKTQALDKTAYIRIHIRANSNNEIDQDIKYKVKSSIVNYLTPKIAECKTLENAHLMIKTELKNIDAVANKVLLENGFNYFAKSRLNHEYFPKRAYSDLVLDEGIYDALIVDLGKGCGNNWWCVVYPPLCFIGAENDGSNKIVYKSKIVELINKYCK